MDLDATVRPPRRLQAHNRDGAERKNLFMQKISDLVEKDENQEVDMTSVRALQNTCSDNRRGLVSDLQKARELSQTTLYRVL